MEVEIRSLGLRPYREVWQLQRTLQQAVIEERSNEMLLLCEHPPVITLGQSAKDESLRLPRQELTRRNVEILRVERGGDATYHGPGQLVGYPILDLRKRRRDVHWYLRSLEAILVATLEDFGISGRTIEGRTGVWIPQRDDSVKKIASIGVRLSRWCTMHGFALNVDGCEEGFSAIHPCGLRDCEVTSMTGETESEVTLALVEDRVIAHFQDLFP